jgi:hypothetical protein
MARVYLRGLVAVAAGNLVGYAAVVGWVVSVTAPQATSGQLDIMELLPTLGAVLAAVGVGAVIGRIAPPHFAPVGAAAMSYLSYTLAVYGDFYIGRDLLIDMLAFGATSRDYLRVPVEILMVKGGLATALGLAALAWVLRAPRTAYAASLTAGLALVGVLLVGGVRVEVPEAYEAVCLDGEPIVCVDRAHDHLLERYHAQVAVELAKLPALDLDAAVFVPMPELLRFSADFAGATPDLPPETLVMVAPISKRNTNPAHEIDPARFTATFGEGLFRRPCLPADGSGAEMAFVLYHWWLTENRLPTDGSNFPGEPATGLSVDHEPRLRELMDWFTGLPEAQRQRWLTEHQAAVLTCTATGPTGTGQQ